MSKKSRSTAAPAVPMTPDTRTLPLHDAVSRQAEKLWERYGRPQGRDDEIWLEAERQVLGADRQANQQPGGAIPAAPLSDVFNPTAQTNSRRSESGHRAEPGLRADPAGDSRREDSAREDGKLGAPGADTGLPK